MLRICSALSLLLTGCMIGEDPSETGSLAANADDVGADALRWDSFSSDCASTRHGIVAIGGDLSVLFGAGEKWTECKVSGVIRVPANLRLTSLYQAVRTAGTAAPLTYTSKLAGTTITTKQTPARDGFETTASLATLGKSLCARTGTAARTVSFSIVTSVASSGAYLDSIDWSFGAEPCP